MSTSGGAGGFGSIPPNWIQGTHSDGKTDDWEIINLELERISALGFQQAVLPASLGGNAISADITPSVPIQLVGQGWGSPYSPGGSVPNPSFGTMLLPTKTASITNGLWYPTQNNSGLQYICICGQSQDGSYLAPRAVCIGGGGHRTDHVFAWGGQIAAYETLAGSNGQGGDINVLSVNNNLFGGTLVEPTSVAGSGSGLGAILRGSDSTVQSLRAEASSVYVSGADLVGNDWNLGVNSPTLSPLICASPQGLVIGQAAIGAGTQAVPSLVAHRSGSVVLVGARMLSHQTVTGFPCVASTAGGGAGQSGSMLVGTKVPVAAQTVQYTALLDVTSGTPATWQIVGLSADALSTGPTVSTLAALVLGGPIARVVAADGWETLFAENPVTPSQAASGSVNITSDSGTLTAGSWNAVVSSPTLPAGTYLVWGQVTVNMTNAQSVDAAICQGSSAGGTIICGGSGKTAATTDLAIPLAPQTVVLSSAQEITLECRPNGSATGPVAKASGVNTATAITGMSWQQVA